MLAIKFRLHKGAGRCLYLTASLYLRLISHAAFGGVPLPKSRGGKRSERLSAISPVTRVKLKLGEFARSGNSRAMASRVTNLCKQDAIAVLAEKRARRDSRRAATMAARAFRQPLSTIPIARARELLTQFSEHTFTCLPLRRGSRPTRLDASRSPEPHKRSGGEGVAAQAFARQLCR